MTLTKIPILDEGGLLLPLTDDHINIALNRHRAVRYALMTLDQLWLRCQKGYVMTIDLFIELHLRASTSVMNEEGCYLWDCVPFTSQENSWAGQLERARLIMSYDYRWNTPCKKPRTYSESQKHRVLVRHIARQYVQSYVRWSKGKRQVLLPEIPQDPEEFTQVLIL
jgi:hypothetical protein